MHETLTNILVQKKADHQTAETDLHEELELTNMFSVIINKIKCEIIKNIFITKDEFSELIEIHYRLYGILKDESIVELKDNWSLDKADQLFNNLIDEIKNQNKSNNSV